MCLSATVLGAIVYVFASVIVTVSRGYDACEGLTIAEWSLLFGTVCAAPTSMLLYPTALLFVRSPVEAFFNYKGDRAHIMRKHTNVLLLLYCSDMCWQGTAQCARSGLQGAA